MAALEQAIVVRQPSVGLVHHSDRGVQYASAEYVAVLEKHGMIPSMSRPANPYDNASCESFLKTLKREEIYANQYSALEPLRANIEEFIERYYNRLLLHSALGYCSPEEFEQQAEHLDTMTQSRGATMEFFPCVRMASIRMLGKGTPEECVTKPTGKSTTRMRRWRPERSMPHGLHRRRAAWSAHLVSNGVG
jgi:Integrase core domain